MEARSVGSRGYLYPERIDVESLNAPDAVEVFAAGGKVDEGPDRRRTMRRAPTSPIGLQIDITKLESFECDELEMGNAMDDPLDQQFGNRRSRRSIDGARSGSMESVDLGSKVILSGYGEDEGSIHGEFALNDDLDKEIEDTKPATKSDAVSRLAQYESYDVRSTGGSVRTNRSAHTSPALMQQNRTTRPQRQHPVRRSATARLAGFESVLAARYDEPNLSSRVIEGGNQEVFQSTFDGSSVGGNPRRRREAQEGNLAPNSYESLREKDLAHEPHRVSKSTQHEPGPNEPSLVSEYKSMFLPEKMRRPASRTNQSAEHRGSFQDGQIPLLQDNRRNVYRSNSGGVLDTASRRLSRGTENSQRQGRHSASSKTTWQGLSPGSQRSPLELEYKQQFAMPVPSHAARTKRSPQTVRQGQASRANEGRVVSAHLSKSPAPYTRNSRSNSFAGNTTPVAWSPVSEATPLSASKLIGKARHQSAKGTTYQSRSSTTSPGRHSGLSGAQAASITSEEHESFQAALNKLRPSQLSTSSTDNRDPIVSQNHQRSTGRRANSLNSPMHSSSRRSKYEPSKRQSAPAVVESSVARRMHALNWTASSPSSNTGRHTGRNSRNLEQSSEDIASQSSRRRDIMRDSLNSASPALEGAAAMNLRHSASSDLPAPPLASPPCSPLEQDYKRIFAPNRQMFRANLPSTPLEQDYKRTFAPNRQMSQPRPGTAAITAETTPLGRATKQQFGPTAQTIRRYNQLVQERPSVNGESMNGVIPDPSSPNQTVEVSPGLRLPFIGVPQTKSAMEKQQISTTACFACNLVLHFANSAEYVICPACHVISPTRMPQGQFGKGGTGSQANPNGAVALGYTGRRYGDSTA